jgi:hypothetical protein
MGAVDDFRVDTRLNGLDHALVGAFRREIDGAGTIEIQSNSGLVRGDECKNDLIDLSACEKVRLQRIGFNLDARLHRGNAAVNDEPDGHAAQPHRHHGDKADRGIGDSRTNPDPEEVEEYDYDDQADKANDCHQD